MKKLAVVLEISNLPILTLFREVWKPPIAGKFANLHTPPQVLFSHPTKVVLASLLLDESKIAIIDAKKLRATQTQGQHF